MCVCVNSSRTYAYDRSVCVCVPFSFVCSTRHAALSVTATRRCYSLQVIHSFYRQYTICDWSTDVDLDKNRPIGDTVTVVATQRSSWRKKQTRRRLGKRRPAARQLRFPVVHSFIRVFPDSSVR